MGGRGLAREATEGLVESHEVRGLMKLPAYQSTSSLLGVPVTPKGSGSLET